jgi:hypothetical protein
MPSPAIKQAAANALESGFTEVQDPEQDGGQRDRGIDCQCPPQKAEDDDLGSAYSTTPDRKESRSASATPSTFRLSIPVQPNIHSAPTIMVNQRSPHRNPNQQILRGLA